MDPPNKRQKKSDSLEENGELDNFKKPTKIQIKLDEITNSICKTIDNKQPNRFAVDRSFGFSYHFIKLRMENIIKVINHLVKNTIIDKLTIFKTFINNDSIKYLLSKLLTNESVKNLEFLQINFDNINYFNELRTLFSIPNKITGFEIGNLVYDNQNRSHIIFQLQQLIQHSFLINLKLNSNNFTLNEMIEIIKILPTTLKRLDITLEYETNNFSLNKIEINDDLVLEFANAIENTKLEALIISYHLFNFTQSCVIVNKLPKTLKIFDYSIRNNNYANKESLKNMQQLSTLIYNNFNLIKINIDYGRHFVLPNQLIPHHNLAHLFNNNKLAYDRIMNLINFYKLFIQTRNEILEKRNCLIPLDKESVFNMILCANKFNKQQNAQQNTYSKLPYLPIEVLDVVSNFVFDKSILDIKNKMMSQMKADFKISHQRQLDMTRENYNESIQFADRLVKRKLLDRATTERNQAIIKYNNEHQKLIDEYNMFLHKVKQIETIFYHSH